MIKDKFCVNKNIPYRSFEEHWKLGKKYRENNIDKIKDYRENNKNKIK